jgi:hypothetical protein
MKKVYVKVEVKMLVRMDEDEIIEDVMENMDYGFTASESSDADIEETEITDWEIIDTK